MTATPAAEPHDEVRQIVVHPAVWEPLEKWLGAHGLVLALMPNTDPDDLPTYVMCLRDPAAVLNHQEQP